MSCAPIVERSRPEARLLALCDPFWDVDGALEAAFNDSMVDGADDPVTTADETVVDAAGAVAGDQP